MGRLVEKKGHKDLLQACRLLQERGHEFECRIVGEGPMRQLLESQIAGQNLQEYVKLLGDQPQDTILELLGNWADVFVLPCVIAEDGDRDGIPAIPGGSDGNEIAGHFN